MLEPFMNKSYLLRIRMPFGDIDHPKNFLTKMKKYVDGSGTEKWVVGTDTNQVYTFETSVNSDNGVTITKTIRTNKDSFGIWNELKIIKLGSDVEKGESLQVVIPANCWFGAHVAQQNSFALCGCTVAPGFDFRDFEMADRQDLLKKYPGFEKEIIRLTRD